MQRFLIVKIKGLTRKIIMDISYKNDPNDEIIYLYNDGCIPTRSKENMNNYLTRLQKLAKLKLE